MNSFEQQVKHYGDLIQKKLEASLPTSLAPSTDDYRKDSIYSFILHGGKRLRPILAMIMAKELGFDSDNHTEVFCALEIFHDFILTHDDIIDQDTLRRGNPTLHESFSKNLPEYTIADRQHFGHSQAIIAGDVMFALSQDYILHSRVEESLKLKLLSLLSSTLQAVSHGRYKQFLSDYLSLSQISLDYIIQYNHIEVTSSYSFLFPLQFGQILATGNTVILPQLREFANNLGILFQLGDDILGLFGESATTGKSNDGDIFQGKKTILMYMTYHHSSSQNQAFLDSRLGQDDLTQAEIKRIKDLVAAHGLVPTQNLLNEYLLRCTELLALLPYSSTWKDIFSDFLSYLRARKL